MYYFIEFPFSDLLNAHIKQIHTDLTELRLLADETRQEVASMCVQKGTRLNLPVQLPFSNEEDFTELCGWLEKESHLDNFVSYLTVYRLYGFASFLFSDRVRAQKNLGCY